MLRTLTMAVLLGLTALLAGCSGGSANLSTPILGPDPNTDCGKKPALCTTMVFYDDPVENLRYECGVNKDLTDAEGRFICPMGLDVLFYLGANKEVKLGSIKVPTSEVIDHAKRRNYVLKDWVTPIDLARAEKPTDVSTCSGDSSWKSNVLRLIRSLDHDGDAFNAQEAVNRIKIPTKELDSVLASKFLATAPVKDFKPCDFADTTKFETTFGAAVAGGVLFDLEAALQATQSLPVAQRQKPLNKEDAGRLLATADYANTRFEAVRQQLLGGTYTIVGPISSASGVGSNASGYQFLVDRTGEAFGFGVLHRLDGTTSEGTVNYLYDTFYFRQLPETLRPTFAEDGTLTNFSFATRPEKGKSNAVGTLRLDGRMLNNQLWPFDYNYNGSGVTAKDSELGVWKETTESGQLVANSQGGFAMLMQAALPTNIVDGDWSSVVPSGSGGPRHYELHLGYTDSDGSQKSLGDLPMTILRNGSVITDLNDNCQAVDVSIMKDGGGQQEYRIGVIGSVRTVGSTKLATLYIDFGIDLRQDATQPQVVKDFVNVMNGVLLDRSTGDVGILIGGSEALTLREVDSAGKLGTAKWSNGIPTNSAATDPKRKGTLTGGPRTCP